MNVALHQELAKVSLRYRRLLLRTGVAACFLALAVAGLLLLMWARGSGYAVPGIALVLLLVVPAIAIPLLVSALRTVRSPLWVARRIERRYPDLDARLLAALEQQQDPSRPLGYLEQTVIGESLEHARHRNWEALVTSSSLRVARFAQWAMVVAFAVVVGSLVNDMRTRRAPGHWWAGGVVRDLDGFAIKVEPEDAEVERGSTLIVLAKFGKRLPGEIELLYKEPEGDVRRLPMSKSLDDPIFAGRLSSVSRDLTYSVRYGDEQTRWYKVGVFDYPDLKQADAKLKYPEYTGMEEKVVEDTRSVTAVEGTKATLTFRLNKPVTGARLVPSPRGQSATQESPQPVELKADPSDPSVYHASLDMRQSQSFKLHLTDDRGRQNKQPAELALNVTQNRPPELKMEFPGRDVDVSALEELSVKAQVWDDFGVKRVGMSYGIAGGEEKELTLAEGVKGKEKKQIAELLSLESLHAEPDQLLSYHLWVEDLGPDGSVRRTAGDMFFAEVRPFDQIYRQGQQPAGGQQQQQQQQQGGNAQQAEELAELQKQIINATWKVIRREISATPTQQFVPDTKLIGESQASAKEKAAALDEKLEDERSKAHLRNVLKHMDGAVDRLEKASSGPSIGALPGALSSEQAAYQELLKLRAREHQVVRSNQRQRQQGSNSSAQNRRQQQLDQLQLDQEENRYETQRQAEAQQEDPAQRETRQVLSRLRELAQRQEDLNRQMRELQNALEQARDEQKREELKRQLARLREQQQQMLRDTDELRDRMDQPENQQRMADARQQLEQTRENVRRASEALEQGQMPQAQSSGARAQEQLNDLREDFRKSTAGQFSEAMDRMRQDARQLDQRQQELSQKMNELDKTEQRALRDTGDRQQVAQNLDRQKQDLDKLLNDMRKTIEESETSEPLLSKQLYDTVRDAHELQPQQALDNTKQLLERGFVNEARQMEADAGKGVTRLREGVEKAAESVLGDETEALRRARNELDALAQELDREIGRRGGRAASATQPTTAPGPRGEQYAQADSQQRGERQPSQQQDGQQPGQQQDGQQPGQQQEDGQQQGQRPGEQQQGGQQPGQRQGEQQQGGQQPGQQQPGDQQGGQQPGQQQQGGQQQGGQQQGGQQPGGQQQSGRQQQDGQQQGGRQQGGGLREGGDQRGGQRQRGDRAGDLRQFLENGARQRGGDTGPGGYERFSGPLTGDNWRDWSDRLRDVEEMVGDPRLRAEAARIRDRAQSVRSEFNRHSKEPNWDIVRDFINRPLVELRDQVSQELLKRQSAEALVPIDREPVPPEYADQVRRYYERLGGGTAPVDRPGAAGGRQ